MKRWLRQKRVLIRKSIFINALTQEKSLVKAFFRLYLDTLYKETDELMGIFL